MSDHKLEHVFGLPQEVFNTFELPNEGDSPDGYMNIWIGANNHIRLLSSQYTYVKFIRIDMPTDTAFGTIISEFGEDIPLVTGVPDAVIEEPLLLDGDSGTADGMVLSPGIPEIFKSSFKKNVISVAGISNSGLFSVTKL